MTYGKWQTSSVADEIVPEGLRHRKRDRTRATLEAAAIDLFYDQGFEHTTIDEIAAKAGVSSRTFFRYFNTKQDALFPNVEADLEATKQFLARDHGDTSSMDLVRIIAKAIAGTFSKDFLGEEFKRNKVIVTSDSLRGRQIKNQRMLEICLANGLARDDIDPMFTNVVAAACVAALSSAVETWVAGDAQDVLTDLVMKSLDYLSAGLQHNPASTTITPLTPHATSDR